MTTLRRTFDAPIGQILVVVHVETGEVQCATRPDGWDQWTVPLPEIDRQDDTEPGRRRGYDHGGMAVFPVEADDPCPTCGGRGWHTAGGNDPMPCGRCSAGEAFAGDGVLDG